MQTEIEKREPSDDMISNMNTTSKLENNPLSSTSFRGNHYSNGGLKQIKSTVFKDLRQECLEENIPEFQNPVNNYIPPVDATEEEKHRWKKQVSKMKNELRGFMKGGKELKNFMQSEVQKSKKVRNELFCKYYMS